MIFILVLPALFLLSGIFRYRRVIVTHRETFTLGFLWYAGLPLVLSTLQLRIDFPEFKYWRSIATLMGPERLSVLTLWSGLIWLSFIAGCYFARQGKQQTLCIIRLERERISGWQMVLVVVGVAALVFGVAWGISYRSLLFRGYADAYDEVARGPLQGALLYTSIAATIAFLLRDQVGRTPILLLATVVTFLTVLSLSVGTRTMPVLVLVSTVVVASRLRGGLPRTALAAGAVGAVLALSALAAWRQGIGNLRFALLTPALEPLFTYISVATYLTFNDIPVLAFPAPLLGSLANLVPRFIWPTKVVFINSLTDNVHLFAPLGAMHLFASLLLNFGWIGSLFIVFVIGLGTERLSRSAKPTAIASYGVIVAVLMTDFWRNPLSQSLIKNVLQGAILVPAVLVVAAIALQSDSSATLSSSDRRS